MFVPSERLYEIPLGPLAPGVIPAIIEVPRGSAKKYEYNPTLGIPILDRVLYASMAYPGDYGFVPSTRGLDGDPLDIMVISSFPFYPGVLVRARVLGLLELEGGGGRDVKLLAATHDNPRHAGMNELSDLGRHTLVEIEHFFVEHKTLEGKVVASYGWRDRATAITEVLVARDRARQLGLPAGRKRVAVDRQA